MRRGGGIADITYVADWDGKGRSNDEEADVRSQWIDKATGKVINLSNYAYSQMSGWGGYPQDMTVFKASNANITIRTRSYNKITAAPVIADIINLSTYIAASDYNGKALKIKGYSTNAEARLSATVWANNFSEQIFTQSVPLGEVLTVPAFEKETINMSYLYLSVEIPQSSGKSFSLDDTCTIELLPDYPGALVSDGVDDSGTAQDNFSEPIGTVIVHYEDLGMENQQYVFNTDWETEGRLYMWNDSGTISMGVPVTAQKNGDPFAILTREPSTPSGKLALAAQNKTAIYRLMLIKEQLDDTQLEFLMWKVSKEYRDWCKENGYEYAISEMLNN